MLFLPQSPYLLLALSSLLFTGAQAGDRKTIGYRTIDELSAKAINGDKDDISDAVEKEPGVFYLTENPIHAATANEWYCVVKADDEEMNKIKKMWIPEVYNGIELWKNEKELLSYIKTNNKFSDPEKVLRFSRLGNFEPTDIPTVMIIHPKIIADNELELWSECFPTQEEMPVEHPSETIAWKDWTIAGGSELPPQTSESSGLN